MNNKLPNANVMAIYIKRIALSHLDGTLRQQRLRHGREKIV